MTRREVSTGSLVAGHSPGARLVRLCSQVVRFGWVSLLGLVLDTGVFLVLVALGVRPLWANLAGASLAVTFVFFASVKRVFEDPGGFLIAKFAAYAGYQVLAVLAASAAVDLLVARGGLPPLWAKLAILPVTFGANFLFMRLLTARHENR